MSLRTCPCVLAQRHKWQVVAAICVVSHVFTLLPRGGVCSCPLQRLARTEEDTTPEGHEAPDWGKTYRNNLDTYLSQWETDSVGWSTLVSTGDASSVESNERKRKLDAFNALLHAGDNDDTR